MTSLNPLPPIEDVIPQRGNMLLIDRLLDYNDETSVAECSPKSDAWYADVNGNMPAWIGIELMAQAVAAHVGLLKQSTQQPQKNGVLVGTRRYSTTVSSFKASHLLKIQVTVVFQDESGLGAYDCHIFDGDKSLGNATIKVFEPHDFQTFLQESKS